VRAAREYLHEHLADAVALDELCAVAGMAPFRLVRAFRRAYGVPPHRYQLGLRVARAKELMRCGRELVDVAGEVGFYDQSHLARHFKRHTGVTPRAYALAVGPPPKRRS
jgi:AraC-like DNA-binding protein